MPANRVIWIVATTKEKMIFSELPKKTKKFTNESIHKKVITTRNHFINLMIPAAHSQGEAL